jgi:ubiquitin-protein ligase
MSISKI